MVLLVATLPIVLAAGCSMLGGSGSSPSPNATSTPAGTLEPSTPPTLGPSPAPTILSSQGTLTHPTGSTDVVLRMAWGGGLVPPEYFALNVPQFTLYGDGTVVFKAGASGAADTPNATLPWMLTVRLTENEVQALLGFALHDGGLATAKTSYDYPGFADAGTTTFTIHAGGVDKNVSVYALYEGASDGPDQADRTALIQLQGRLNNLMTDMQAGNGSEPTPYDATEYRVTLLDETGIQPSATPQRWPWTDTTVDDFVTSADHYGASRTMTRDQVSRVADVPNAGQTGIWIRTPDGKLVECVVRPLLPDEISSSS